MRTAILAVLQGDGTLLATLTGGVHDAGSVQEISRQNTPAAFDASGEIRPCALVRMTTETPEPPFEHGARLYFSVMFYQRYGQVAIDVARARVYLLLHRAKVAPGSGGCWEIAHADDVLDVEDAALGCGMAISRFVAVVRRA